MLDILTFIVYYLFLTPNSYEIPKPSVRAFYVHLDLPNLYTNEEDYEFFTLGRIGDSIRYNSRDETFSGDYDDRVWIKEVDDPDIKEYNPRNHHPPPPAAVARFEDTLLKTGWGILDVETNDEYQDGAQAYAAGFAEGFATAKHIYPTALNMAYYHFDQFKPKKQNERSFKSSRRYDDSELVPIPEKLRLFLEDQDAWARKMVTKHQNLDMFWFNVGLVLEQLDGLMDGYHHYLRNYGSDLAKPLPKWVFLMLNAVGDMNDLIPALLTEYKYRDLQRSYNYFEQDVDEVMLRLNSRSSCSSLVKILPGNEDLLVGHNTWFTYESTNRIFKHYNLNFRSQSIRARGISFSSYPGFLESIDDFYMLSSNITWTQTSNPVLDKTLYHENNNIKPQALLAWQRVRVASAMSWHGPDFLTYMKNNFSGTYANQYIVVDYKLFDPKHDLKDNTLFIVEEMPGLILGGDLTDMLRFGYWPSYNVPFFREIYERSGYKKLLEKHGNRFSYSLAPRAEIFRRDHNKVDSLEGLKRILRYNDYKNDVYSSTLNGDGQNPSSTLCARGDLQNDALLNKYISTEEAKQKIQAYGCYDAKATSFTYATKRRAEIVSGPTSDYSFGAEYLQAFSWEKFDRLAHFGLPPSYKFGYVKTKPFYALNSFFGEA